MQALWQRVEGENKRNPLAPDDVRRVTFYCGQYVQDDAGTFPLDQWVCVELALGIGTDGSARLSVDGNLLADATGVVTVPASTPHYISTFGGASAVGAEGFDVLLDELVVATEPVGCEVAATE